MRGLPAGAEVLDPAAGTGRLLAAVADVDGRARLKAVERDPQAASTLTRALPDVELQVADALTAAVSSADAVVLNPPYENADRLDASRHVALAARWPFYRRQLDLSVLFMALGVDALRPGGRMAAIVPRYWLEATGAAGFRAWLAQRTAIESVLDLGNTQVFARADVLSALIVVRKASPSRATTFARLKPGRPLQEALRVPPAGAYEVEQLGGEPWSQRPPEEEAALGELERRGSTVGHWFKIGQGVKTGCNAAFVVQGAQARALRHAGVAQAPFVRPRDIARDGVRDTDRWLLLAPESDPHPELLAWLEPKREALEGRFQVRDGSVPWYALSIAQNLPLLRASPKLLHPLYARAPRFAVDTRGVHVSTGAYALVPRRELPCAIHEAADWLNGPEVARWAAARTKLKRDGYREFGRRALAAMPVPWELP